MDTRFAHLYKRDSSVSMIRVKMSRRRSQSQKENREKMQNLRRQLDQLPELDLFMDVSTLETPIAVVQPTQAKAKEFKIDSAAEERKKMLARFKENKALQKEKEKREKEKKGVFKVGLYRPQPLGFLPVNPVVTNTGKTSESMQTTRVTRSMKQQQQPKPIERQAAPKKAEPASRAVKASAPASGRGRVAADIGRTPATRSSARNVAVASKAVAKPAADHRVLKTRSANKNPTAPTSGKGKAMQGAAESALPDEKKPAEVAAVIPPRPAEEEEKKKVEDVKVTPTSFAPQGFVFQPPSGLKVFQPAPLSPCSADAFLSPSFSFEPKIEPVTSAPPPSASFPVLSVSSSPPPPPSPLPSCKSNPSPVSDSAPVSASPPAASSLAPLEAPEPQHDVPYFRAAMAEVTDRLTSLSALWESRFDDSSIPEDMRDQMRMAVGQARLLMKERFSQFGGLVDDCELGRGEKITTCTDLQGFWDMVYFQVEDVDRKFSAIKEAEARGWQEETKPVVRQKKVAKKPPIAGSKTGAGGGASAAAKSRLAAVKAAMKAKQAAEKASGASGDAAPVQEAAPPSQTVVFHGGFFQVESPVKLVGAVRRSSRLTAASLLPSSPCGSKFITPNKQKHPAEVTCPSPLPPLPVTPAKEAQTTVSPARVSCPSTESLCVPQHPADSALSPSKPLRFSPERSNLSLHVSPAKPVQSDHDTSQSRASPSRSDLMDVPLDSPMKLSSDIEPTSPSCCPLEPALPLCASEPVNNNVEPERCPAQLNEVRTSIQESPEMASFVSDRLQADSPVRVLALSFAQSPAMSNAPPRDESEDPCALESSSPCIQESPEMASFVSDRLQADSPVRVLALSFAPSPVMSNAPPRDESEDACPLESSSPCIMSTTPPQERAIPPAPVDGAAVNASEGSPRANCVTTENPKLEDLDFERYLQPVARHSLSPVHGISVERFSLGAADVEMESPVSQAEEEPAQDFLITPTAAGIPAAVHHPTEDRSETVSV